MSTDQAIADRGLYIDGGWRRSASGDTVTIHDPATGELVGNSALAGAADVDAAVDAATRAQPDWARTPPEERATILHRAAELVVQRADEIAVMLTREQGKPIPDSRKEILFGADVLHYYAEEGRRQGGSIRPSVRPDIRSLVSWAPVGVVAAIVPWNYPVDLYCWKIGPALAAGNAVVVKPPAETPFAVGLLAQCLADAGLPAGILADLPGALDAGKRLSSHPHIDMITATASTRTGQSLMRAAADTLKKLSLELGGQCPFIVLDDADVQEAATAAARRSFSNAGQICIAVNRILVADALADDFTAAVADAATRIVLGHGLDPAIDYGPITTPAVGQRAAEHITDAVGQGARVIAGGGPARGGDLDRGHFFRPTVLDHVPVTARIMNEETFGPVVAVHRLAPGTDVAAVAAIANATPYGLAAYVFGNDLDRAWVLADQLHVGGVGININDITELQAPFGGWKMSGFGRELGPEALTAFSQQRHVRIRRRATPATVLR